MGRESARAPTGRLETFARERFTHGDVTRDVYRKGQGPAVIVLAEMPGISPMVLGFADRVIALGCTAVLPDLFGEAGRDPLDRSPANRLHALRTIATGCISREFTTFATGRTSEAVTFLRALAVREHARCGGPGVGVVGMCFTGGFALGMAVEPCVLAPVMSQPSLPIGVTPAVWRAPGCSDDDLAAVAHRCAKDDLKVIGLRFKGDVMVPAARFARLREALGDGFVAVELEQRDGHPDSPLPRHHSVLTVDLVDAPGEPTREALDTVLALFRDKLLSA